MKLVLANGCFDMLHAAHVRHLQEARSMGALLVVGVTMDAFVGKGNGRPVIPQDERLELVRALGCVYEAQLCRDSLEALRYFDPNIFCKGADYLESGLLPEERAYCEANAIEIRHTKPNPQTTTGIIKRIRSIECAYA